FTGVIVAISIQNQRVVDNVKVQDLPYRILYVLYPGITKFLDLMAFGTDQVIMLSVSVGLFVLGQVLSELMFGDQIALYQKIQRIIDRRPAHPVVFVFHAYIEGFYVEMPISVVNFL